MSIPFGSRAVTALCVLLAASFPSTVSIPPSHVHIDLHISRDDLILCRHLPQTLHFEGINELDEERYDDEAVMDEMIERIEA